MISNEVIILTTHFYWWTLIVQAQSFNFIFPKNIEPSGIAKGQPRLLKWIQILLNHHGAWAFLLQKIIFNMYDIC